jgi:hypothetical protein
VAGVAPRTGIAVVGIGPQPRHQRRGARPVNGRIEFH